MNCAKYGFQLTKTSDLYFVPKEFKFFLEPFSLYLFPRNIRIRVPGKISFLKFKLKSYKNELVSANEIRNFARPKFGKWSRTIVRQNKIQYADFQTFEEQTRKRRQFDFRNEKNGTIIFYRNSNVVLLKFLASFLDYHFLLRVWIFHPKKSVLD